MLPLQALVAVSGAVVLCEHGDAALQRRRKRQVLKQRCWMDVCMYVCIYVNVLPYHSLIVRPMPRGQYLHVELYLAKPSKTIITTYMHTASVHTYSTYIHIPCYGGILFAKLLECLALLGSDR